MRRTLTAGLVAAFVAAFTAISTAQGPQQPAQAAAPTTARKTTPVRDREKMLLENYDANGNGKVDAEEREAMRADMQANAAKLRQRLDAERGRGPRSARSSESMRRVRERGAEILRQFDTDGDGQLNATEGEAYEASTRASREKLNAQILARFDTNRNGKIDPAERRAMQARAR